MEGDEDILENYAISGIQCRICGRSRAFVYAGCRVLGLGLLSWDFKKHEQEATGSGRRIKKLHSHEHACVHTHTSERMENTMPTHTMMECTPEQVDGQDNQQAEEKQFM